MSAGGSQTVMAAEQALAAASLEQQSHRLRAQAGRHRAGCLGEREVCQALSRLAMNGVHHLDDLRFRADDRLKLNLDHLVIAPTGVFVVDAKNWAGRVTVSANGQLLEDGQAREHRLVALRWLCGRVAEVMATTTAARVLPVGLICFSRAQAAAQGATKGLLCTDVARIGELITDRPAVLTPDEVAELHEVLSYAFPPYALDGQAEAEAVGLLFPDEVTRHAGLAEVLRRPVEAWMAWVHPTQAATVHRSFAGPARIRGAAGTGKTSVGLHRIAWLASTRPGRFLVTSYVKTLPLSLSDSYRVLSPTTADRVDFEHVHGVALRLLAEAGHRVSIDVKGTAFNLAWQRHADGLQSSALRAEYFREELTSVIKGRALATLDEYLALVRVGRRTPLRPEIRERVWRLYEDYEATLQMRGQVDYTDVLRLGRDFARAAPQSPWRGVMVDEVQDLPLVGLQMLHSLAGGDRADGLLLIGDGEQAIYPGGFSLAEAGITIANRGVVLKLNYRNTVEILAAARLAIAGESYDDLEDQPQTGARDIEVARHGEAPSIATYDSVDVHDAALAYEIHQLLDRGIEPRAVAVLCQTNRGAQEYARRLASAGIETVQLSAPGYAAVDAVRIGTWSRSKGMEFPHVFLPQANKPSALLTGAGEGAFQEKQALLKRQQYVAMTRARDTLWVGNLRLSP